MRNHDGLRHRGNIAIALELRCLIDLAEGTSDLEIAKTPRTGFELDAIDALRRETDRLMTDQLLYGTAYVMDGKRVDPTSLVHT